MKGQRSKSSLFTTSLRKSTFGLSLFAISKSRFTTPVHAAMAVAAALQRLSTPFLLPARRRLCSSSVSSGGELYDLVIVGGGLVGSALACNVGREPSLSNRKILLLESNPSAPRPVSADDPYSNRVSALSLGSVELMRKLGAWKMIEGVRANAFTQLHVWDACSEARLVFNRWTSNEFGMITGDTSHDQETTSEDIVGSSYRGHPENMGYIVENKVIMAALLNILEDCSNVEVQRGVKVTEVEPPTTTGDNGDASSPWVELTLDNGKAISTRLLVGSDGPGSRIRQLCDFQYVSWKYNQSALVATLHIHPLNSNSTAWQRFLPTGPIAMLPLSNTLCCLIWSTTPSHAHSLLELSEERFVDAVNSAFWDPLPQDDLVTKVNEVVRDALASLNADSPPSRQLPPTVSGIDKDSRAAFPLSMGHAPHYVKPRIALVGDAAHRVHVMAGQGLNLGLGDVANLTQQLLRANSMGADWGSLSTLLEYETARQRHNVPTALTIEGLYHLFSTSWTPAVLLRSIGFQITNALPNVKHFFMEQAQKTG